MSSNEISLFYVSEEQINKMKHALGLLYKTKPYRNYYNCDYGNVDWNDLVYKGFASVDEPDAKGRTNFHLTFEAAKLVYGKRMSKKFYDKL